MSTNEKKKIEYSKCFCYGKGNCGPYTQLKVDNTYKQIQGKCSKPFG